MVAGRHGGSAARVSSMGAMLALSLLATIPAWGDSGVAGVVTACGNDLDGLTPGPQLVWEDPRGLVATSLEPVACELESLFHALGVRVGVTGESVVAEARTPAFRVVLMSAPKPHWRLPPEALAAAPRSEQPEHEIYVFVEQVERVLGHTLNAGVSETARERVELSRALARIIAHEVVHVVAPDHPHAAFGLMSTKQRRPNLLKRRPQIDPACRQAFFDGLETF